MVQWKFNRVLLVFVNSEHILNYLICLYRLKNKFSTPSCQRSLENTVFSPKYAYGCLPQNAYRRLPPKILMGVSPKILMGVYPKDPYWCLSQKSLWMFTQKTLMGVYPKNGPRHYQF